MSFAQTIEIIALAIAPTLAICIFVYWKNKYEREPLMLMVKCFFWGICAVPVTLMISKGVKMFYAPDKHSFGGLMVYAFLFVALIEELSKFLFLRLLAYREDSFNEPFDGITYSVMISMGFATLENVMYVHNYGVDVAVIRLFSAVPAHATFAVLMGFFIGLAKFKRRNTLLMILSLFVSVLLHGAYDFCLFHSSEYIIVGAVFSLLLTIALSYKAIKIQQENSPFRKLQEEEEGFD